MVGIAYSSRSAGWFLGRPHHDVSDMTRRTTPPTAKPYRPAMKGPSVRRSITQKIMPTQRKMIPLGRSRFQYGVVFDPPCPPVLW